LKKKLKFWNLIKIWKSYQNFHKISKISVFIKFHKISKFSKKKIQNYKIKKNYNFRVQNFKISRNFKMKNLKFSKIKSEFLDSDDNARGSRIVITVVYPISNVQLKIPRKLFKLPVNSSAAVNSLENYGPVNSL
jgi:hypothetical protein